MRASVGRPSRGRLRATASSALILLLGLAAACSSAPDLPPVTGGGSPSDATLVWSKPADMTGLDTLTSSATDWAIFTLVYDTLVTMGDDLDPQPSLATTWEQPSPTETLLTIREDAKFSNGRAMTTDDVVGSLKRLLDPAKGAYYAGKLGDVKKVESVGANQVRVTFGTPNSYFIPALANPAASILPIEELDSGSFDPTKEMIGTGPFKVTNHVQNGSWEFDRNPDYWGEPATAENLKVQIQSTPAAIAALRDGSVDVATFGDPGPLSQLEGVPNVEGKSVQTTNFEGMYVNVLSSTFADPKVREALAAAINRQQIVDIVFGGDSAPQPTATPPGLNGSCDPASIPNSAFDADRARELLSTGGAEGAKVEILAGTDYPADVRTAQVLESQLDAVGFEAKIQQVTAAEAGERAFSDGADDFNLLIGSFAGWGDAAMVLPLWDPKGAPWSTGWFQPNKELNTTINQTQAQPVGNRDTAIQKACDLIGQDLNIIPLVTAPLALAYRTDKVGVTVPTLEGNFNPHRYLPTYQLK